MKDTVVSQNSLWGRLSRNGDFWRFVILVVLMIGFGIATDGIIYSPLGLYNILVQSCVVGIAALGQTAVMLTGGIDISMYGVGLFASILGAAMMTSRFDLNIVGGEPVPVIVGVGAILLAGGLMGLLNGTLVAKMKVPALIVTLGTWQIGVGLAQIVGGGFTITNLPPGLSVIGQGTLFGIPNPVAIMLVLFALAAVVANYTQFGRSVYAVGGNADSAFLSGIRVSRVLLIVYVIAGLTVGIAAVITEARIMSASYRSLSDIHLDSIAAATIGGVSIYGGRGTILGVFLGTLILAVINSGLGILGATPNVEGVVKGLVIIFAISVDYFQNKRGAVGR